MAVDAAFLVEQLDVVLLALAVLVGQEGVNRGEVEQGGERDWILVPILGLDAGGGQAGAGNGQAEQAGAKQASHRKFHENHLLCLIALAEERIDPPRDIRINSECGERARPAGTCGCCRRSWPGPRVRKAENK